MFGKRNLFERRTVRENVRIGVSQSCEIGACQKFAAREGAGVQSRHFGEVKSGQFGAGIECVGTDDEIFGGTLRACIGIELIPIVSIFVRVVYDAAVALFVRVVPIYFLKIGTIAERIIGDRLQRGRQIDAAERGIRKTVDAQSRYALRHHNGVEIFVLIEWTVSRSGDIAHIDDTEIRGNDEYVARIGGGGFSVFVNIRFAVSYAVIFMEIIAGELVFDADIQGESRVQRVRFGSQINTAFYTLPSQKR